MANLLLKLLGGVSINKLEPIIIKDLYKAYVKQFLKQKML